MKKVRLIIVVTLILLISLFVYVVKLRDVAIMGNNLYEERCLNVNPHLIAYKQAFLNFSVAAKSTPDEMTVATGADHLARYIAEMRQYVPEETKWLEKQQAYTNSFGFKYLMPSFLKTAANYQIEMYKGYRDEAAVLVGSIDKKEIQKDFVENFKEARDRKSKFIGLYNDLYQNRSEKFDLRMLIIAQPLPKGCTKENTTIPDTTGALDPDPPEAENPEITG